MFRRPVSVFIGRFWTKATSKLLNSSIVHLALEDSLLNVNAFVCLCVSRHERTCWACLCLFAHAITCMCVCVRVCLRVTLAHVLGDDVDGLLRHHGVQLHQLLVPQLLHDLRLHQEGLGGHGARLQGLDGHARRAVPRSYATIGASVALVNLISNISFA